MSTLTKQINKKATKEQQEKIEKQVQYWQKERATNNFLAGEKSALKVAKELKANYQNTIAEIEEKINAFYGKYADENGMSLRAAKQYLNKGELKNFKSYIEKMLKMGNKENFSASEMTEFNRLYNKAKITRLEELQASIRGELDKLTVETDKQVGDMLYNEYEDTYYRSVYDTQQVIGMDRAFSSMDRKVVEQAINTQWLAPNYSKNIWQNNTNTLTKMLNTEIPRGLTLGYNPKKLAKQVSKRMDIDYNNTVRVIRTEYSKIQNDASLEGYKAAGIKQYQILAALDERTCDICGEVYNGEIFNYDDAETGLNFPPFHPNCRCTTIAYFPKDEIDEMSDEELDNIGFITYDEWKDGLVKLKDGKVIYKERRSKK